MSEPEADLGPQADWILNPPIATVKGAKEAVQNRRPGMAWSSSSSPGAALHGAVCRAAGVHPSTHGTAGAVAAVLGLSKQGYWRLVTRGGAETVVRAAMRLGYYVLVRPGESGDPTWTVGDMPLEVA